MNLYDSLDISPRYRNQSSALRGNVFHARPYVVGERLGPVVVAWWGPAQKGDLLAYCPKGFTDVYVIPPEVFERDFEPLEAINGST